MAHLRKSAATGHLLKNSAGHLVNECPSTTTSTASPTTTTAAPPVNDCNECDPRIPDVLYVTFAGLAGDFAAANGTTALAWTLGCHWEATAGGMTIYLEWTGSRWRIGLTLGGNCYKRWRTLAEPYCDDCDPRIPNTDDLGRTSYYEYECIDTDCDDTDSCEDSAGATAEVSYTP